MFSVLKEILRLEFLNSLVINFVSLPIYVNLTYLGFGYSFFSCLFCFLLE